MTSSINNHTYNIYVENRKFFILSIVWDCLIIIFTLFSAIASLSHFYFMVNVERPTNSPYLFTFTALSNIFVGVVTLICLILKIKNKTNELPLWLFIIKMSSVSMVTITMLTTVCYLAPSLGQSWWKLFINANLFNHLITPIFAIIGFMIFERSVNFKYTRVFYTLIPLGMYSVLYLIRVMSHYNPGEPVDLYYDIYGLARFSFGVLIGFFALFIVLGLLISTGLYFQNRCKKNKPSA